MFYLLLKSCCLLMMLSVSKLFPVCVTLCVFKMTSTSFPNGATPGVCHSVFRNALFFLFGQHSIFLISPSSYHLNNTQLTNKTAHSDLGVTLTSNLRWRDHIIVSVIAKSYKVLGLLRRVLSSVHSPQAKKVLYISLVRSKLLYCSPIWHPHLLTDIKALENIQR